MRRILTLVALILANLTSPAFGQTPSIVIDGNFADWSGIAPLITDPERDGTANGTGEYFPGSDFRRVTLTHDATHLYILLEFAANLTGDITLYLDLDLDSTTGCQGGEVAMFVTESEPVASLAESPNCWTFNTIPGSVTSFPAHNVSRFLEVAIPLGTLRDVTPGTYGLEFSGVAVSPAPVSIDYTRGALYFPGKTSTPRVLLRVNEASPGLPFVFSPSGRVRLTVDVPETTYTGDLSWYWVVVIDGQVLWITAQGISTTPAPFVVAPPVALKNVVLLDLVVPGDYFVTAFFLMDGDTFVAWDSVIAILDDPCCIVLDGDGLAGA